MNLYTEYVHRSTPNVTNLNADHKTKDKSQPRIQGILPSTSYNTLDFGVFIMIIYIGEMSLQNSYAVSRFVDHLIDILKTACRKNYFKNGNSQ